MKFKTGLIIEDGKKSVYAVKDNGEEVLIGSRCQFKGSEKTILERINKQYAKYCELKRLFGHL